MKPWDGAGIEGEDGVLSRGIFSTLVASFGSAGRGESAEGEAIILIEGSPSTKTMSSVSASGDMIRTIVEEQGKNAFDVEGI